MQSTWDHGDEWIRKLLLTCNVKMLPFFLCSMQSVCASDRWSPAKIWPPDTFVRYAKGVFEAQGIQVAAEPGDTGHAQFYVSWIMG